MFQFGIFTAPSTRLFPKLFPRLFAGLFILAAWVSSQSFWTDSEVWATTVVKYFVNNPGTYDFKLKPLSNGLFYLCYLCAKAMDIHPMEVARIFFAANYLLVIYLCYRLIQRQSSDRRWTATLLLALLANSYLLKRGAQVRSDLLVTSVILIWLIIPACKSRWQSWLSFLITTAVAFCITPKSALWMSLLLALWYFPVRAQLAIFACAFASLALLLAYPPLSDAVPALRFFVASFQEGPGILNYFDLSRLWFFNHFILQNPWIVLVWSRNLWAGFYSRQGRSRESLLLIDFANATFLILLIYPDRLPFFIASLVPFWLIALRDLPQDEWWLKIKGQIRAPVRRSVTIVSVIFLLGSFLAWSYQLAFQHNAHTHRQYVAWIRKYEGRLAALNVYDPAGVIPFLPVDHWFLGPSEIHNNDVIERIQRRRPDVILASNKLFLIGRELRDILNKDYWYDGSGIFIRRHILSPTPQAVVRGSELLQSLRPYILDRQQQPLPEFVLELRSKEGVDLSRFAQWRAPSGETRPFDSEVKISDLESDLLVPPETRRWDVLPLKISTPFALSWSQLFSFDSGN